MTISGEKLLTRLFTSRPKIRVIKLFLVNPDEKFGAAEVASRTKLPIGECRRYIGEFIRLGLVKKTRYVEEAKKPRTKKSGKKAKKK